MLQLAGLRLLLLLLLWQSPMEPQLPAITPAPQLPRSATLCTAAASQNVVPEAICP
jgi:hypothetical protein